ncbi:MAG: choline/carnitine O-acyltransferase [Leptolyngbya sp. SIO4C5]|nr:choline/carnitine O-acyltransferase [Leptolyngbya sp. SIO4C5]
MYQPEDILEAARSIRPYLNELIDPSAAEQLDQTLAELLAQAEQNSSVKILIQKHLREHAETRQWVKDFLEDKKLPNENRSFQPLPGHRSIVNAPKFVCPEGDYVWYRPRAGMEPPQCPTHHIPLNPA